MPSDVVIIAIVTGFFVFLGVVTNAVTAVLVAKLNIKASDAATKLEETTKKTDKKLNTIHGLVNSASLITLRALAAAYKRLKLLSTNEDAEQDEQAYQEVLVQIRQHEEQQAKLDEQNAGDK